MTARRRRRRARLADRLLLATLGTALLGAALAVSWEDLAARFRPTTPGATPYAELYRAAADRYPAVTAAQLAAQARAESAFDPDAVSPAGAQGLLQIIPETFERFAVDGDGDGHTDPFDPADSVFTAAHYLSWLSQRLDRPAGDPRVVAAYNAGPGAVERAGGVPDYPETRTYVQRVRGWVKDYRWLDA